MDKKSIIGLVLIFLIFVGYMFWVRPSDEEIAEMRRKDSVERVKAANRADSIAKVEAAALAEQQVKDSLMELAQSDPELRDSLASVAAESRRANMGLFAVNAENPDIHVSVQNKLFNVDLQTIGASVQQVILNDYKTFDDKPLEVITPDTNNMDIIFNDAGGEMINTRNIPFALYCNGKAVTEEQTLEVPENDSLTLSFRAYVSSGESDDDSEISEGKYLEFRYVFYSDSYEIDFDVNFNDITDCVSEMPNLTVVWQNCLNRQEQYSNSQKSRMGERYYTNIYYKCTEDNADYLKENQDNEKQITSPVEWVAYKQQFFCAILMSETAFNNAQQLQIFTDKSNQAPNYLCDMSSILGYEYVPVDGNFKMDMRLYYGPTKYRILRDMDRGFERILPLGWGFFLTQWVSRFAIIPVFNFLENFGWNYGIIIIVLTILLKIVLSPLTYKSYKSGAVMRHLKPEMEALNKKFPKQEQAMQKQQAMSALYKKAGISPLAGCLPALIQFPILIAMYRFYPASIELRQKDFLWCDDLSSYDSILNLPFNIPIYGDHISLFCLLMFGMQFFYTIYTMKQQQGQASMPGMKFMMYFMPFMMLFIFNSQSAALNIYYFFNLLLSMAQMFAIRAFLTEDKVRARMAKAEVMAKSKPQKKSRFQQRLEEMQRMNEELQKQRKK